MIHKNILIVGIISVLLLVGCSIENQTINKTVINNYTEGNDNNLMLGIRTQIENCTFNYPYQDFECSPGHAFPLSTIQINGKYAKEPGSVIVGDICVSGYTKNIRNVTYKLREQVFNSYNIYNRSLFFEYEVDHIVSLELGGDNDIANLYPQKYNMTLGARQKDKVENLLHKMVCEGKISLEQAQYDIAYNWTKYVK
jgi:hypothetical protein